MTTKPVAIAQLNPVVGDIQANAESILRAYEQASAKAAGMLVCPELVLVGYPPEDLLLNPAFTKQATQAARDIAAKTGETGLVFGSPWYEAGVVYNAAIFASHGRIQHIYYKTNLPNYGVFDEKRVFTPGHSMKGFEWGGERLGILVCEDVWFTEHASALARDNVSRVLVINASPFEIGKLNKRKQVVAAFAQAAGAEVVYANMVGGQDDLVFDGSSFVMDAKGYVTHQCASFAEEIGVVQNSAPVVPPPATIHEDAWCAMKLGLFDYVRKNGFKGVLLGLSGGIDSAVTAALAVDALGSENVYGVLLPSPYSSQGSIDDALETANLLGIKTDLIPIEGPMQSYAQTLAAQLGASNWMEEPTVGGNLQARIRGQILMALSNKTGFMLLSTGNKSEIAVGYSTLYGDSCGGYNVLKDAYKSFVYELANWRNNVSRVIPQNSIDKAPSAELKPDQKDSDQLPPYDVLDAILALHIEGRESAEDIIAKGYDTALVTRVLKLVRINEYKRRQSCPGVKLTPMMFGRDRRFPLTNKF